MEVDQTTMVPASHGGESMAQTTGTARAGIGYERGAHARHAGDGWRERVESRL